MNRKKARIFPGLFPQARPRRLRGHDWLRELVAEHSLKPADLVWPVFVIEGKNKREPIESMPGVNRITLDILTQDIRMAYDLGIRAVALFPVVPAEKKDERGTEALNAENLICRAIQTIKNEGPDIGIITDVALDPYTAHGHDGLLENGRILNDKTVEILAQQALVQARAGADIIAPSDMMDGRIGAIRQTLDREKFHETAILSYAAKYASAFYGPFRDAVGSQSALKGDKKTYQMNPTNSAEALREVAMDIEEGADMIMVKPGLAYLDIIRQVKDACALPVFAYHVSGEYAMLRAAAEKSWLDYDLSIMETMMAFKRAGCNGVLTYSALDCARMLNT